MSLPPCSARFAARKAAILAQLAQPDGEYIDASPKGTVDEGVRPLLEVVNNLDGFVSTSSCAGRVAVFLEGRRARATGPGGAAQGSLMDDEPGRDGAFSWAREVGQAKSTGEALPDETEKTVASSGGKGGGGTWLFVSHDPLVAGADDLGNTKDASYGATDWASVFNLKTKQEHGKEDATCGDVMQASRLVQFKFEPMILHVLTASLAHAQLLLRCAMAAGFRESGAVGIYTAAPAPTEKSPNGDTVAYSDNAALPVVAVRSMGLGFASVVGIEEEGNESGEKATVQCIVPPSYLARMVRVADERFAENRSRTERFRTALVAAIEQEEVRPSSTSSLGKKSKPNWEDAAERRARKREEGLRHQAALKKEQPGMNAEETEDILIESGLGGVTD